MPTLSDAIDRQSPTPYYQQLVEILATRISSGRIDIGDRLPSENELCNEFGLARATVRQALQQLETRGVARRVANRGMYATAPTDDRGWLIQSKEGFLENAAGHQNRAISTRVISHGPITLPTEACRSLDLPEQSDGYELVRVRELDGVPALYSTNYSPPEVAPIVATATDVLTGRASFSELLSAAGWSLGGAHRTIHAVTPSREIADLLQVSPATPILRIRSVSWTPAGKRYDVYETYVRSDVIPLEVNVSTVDLPTSSS